MTSKVPLTIIGQEADTTTRHVLAVCAQEQEAVRFLSLDRLYAAGHLAENSSGGTAHDGHSTFDLTRGPIYQRLVVQPESHHFGSAAEHSKALGVSVMLHALLVSSTARVINPIGAGWHNFSKPLHLDLLARHGFDVPASICTSNTAQAMEFVESYDACIRKSTSGIRSIVREVTAADIRAKGGSLAASPVLFQEKIVGTDVRVHIVDDRAFAVHIRSSATDYRYARQAGAPVEMEPDAGLEASVIDRAIAFCRDHDLTIAGFDFKRSPSRGLVCLEVNPSPAFESYDHVLGGGIARALLATMRSDNSQSQHANAPPK